MPKHGLPTLLGIDIGSTRIKAVLLDPTGVERAVSAGPTPFGAAAEGVETTAAELRAAVAAVLAGLGPERAAAVAVGVAGMGECGAPLDAGGEPAGPVIAWYDPRGEAVVERLIRDGGESLAVRTGRRLRTVSSVAKLGWWVERTGRTPHGWLGVPELCLHALGGDPVTDPSLASRTGWYDVAARAYLPEVAAAIGVPLSALPAVVAAGSVAGRVDATGAEWSGLPAGIPVTPAGHDHLAAAAGCGAGPTDLVDSVGTAESLVRRLPGGEPPDRPTLERALALGVAVSARPDGDGWALLGRGPRAGPVLAAAAAGLGGTPLEVLDAAVAAGGRPVAAARLVDALLAGEAPDLPPVPVGELWGGLLDELARRTAAAAAACSELAGPARRALVVGGGARSLPWVRAKARRLGVPVWRAAGSEAAARGAAVAAGVAAGWWPSAAAAPAPVLEHVEG